MAHDQDPEDKENPRHEENRKYCLDKSNQWQISPEFTPLHTSPRQAVKICFIAFGSTTKAPLSARLQYKD